MTEKKGRWQRFLEWLAEGNDKQFGGRPPSCCAHRVPREHRTVHVSKFLRQR